MGCGQQNMFLSVRVELDILSCAGGIVWGEAIGRY